MKGLEIAKDFFLNWGKPFLEQEFPQLAKRVAAGRLLGSDVIGADDEISQDHNWGHSFHCSCQKMTFLVQANSFRKQ